MGEKLQKIRGLEPFGGPFWLAVILACQTLLVLLATIDWKLSAALIVSVLTFVFAIRYPIAAILLLVAGRILSTGSLSFLRIGGMNIGLFEPMLLLALVVAVHHAMHHRLSLAMSFPWRTPLLLFLAWQSMGLLWAYRASVGIQEVVAVCIIFTTTTLILAFVQDFERFRLVMWAWIGASVFVGLLSMTVQFSGMSFEIAAGGGRETGLGQQPNWFAMNLMFGVLISFALAFTYRSFAVRVVLAMMGLFVFFCLLRSGSRGGAYSIVIGAGLMALANPVFRKWMFRFAMLGVLVFAYQITLGGDESTRKAFMRIWLNLDSLWRSDVRVRNWVACMEMFQDTYGVGIGPGGYAQVIQHYDWKIYESIHRYPHGIIWGLIAHYGVVGVGFALWLIVCVAKMAKTLVKQTKGSSWEPFAWAMPATIFAYFAWSVVEFNFDDKPFWEFLALFTALYLCVQRSLKNGEALPRHTAEDKPFPWQSKRGERV